MTSMKADLDLVHESLVYLRKDLSGDSRLAGVRTAVEKVQDPGHHRRNTVLFGTAVRLLAGVLVVGLGLNFFKSAAGYDMMTAQSVMHEMYDFFPGP